MITQEARVVPTQIKKLYRIPTGLLSFDTLIRGGFPSGSMVLLIGEVGAGNTEFAYTSAATLSLLKEDQVKYNGVRKQLENLLIKGESLKIPESICYISFTQSKEDIFRELERSFPPEFASSLNSMLFKDFSSMYFNSTTPTWNVEGNWPSIKAMKGERKLFLLRELSSELDFHAPNSVVIIDSLTKLIRAYDLDWRDLVFFLEDIQRRSKEWDGLVYLLLAKGIFDSMKEEEVMDIADGVLVFEWIQEGFSRQQAMHIKKFRELMPHIAKDNMVKFDTVVTNTDGFAVTNVKRISGRR